MSNQSESTLRARTATLDVLLAPDGIVSKYLDPIPSKRTFNRWLAQAKVPKIKANPSARRGGGVPFFHVASIERLLRQRLGSDFS